MLSSIDFNFSIKIGCCVGSCYPYTSDYFYCPRVWLVTTEIIVELCSTYASDYF